MRTPALAIAIIELIAIAACAQTASRHPKLTLTLPTGVDSAKVEIKTFLTGPFGGYGGFIKPESQKASYDIDPYVDGRPANQIKAIVYMPGCEITKIDEPFTGSPLQQTLTCTPMPPLRFHGQVDLPPQAEGKDAVVELRYQAAWDHQFFGIADGMVSQFRIGRVRPNSDGTFEFDIPDFYRQADLRDAGLQFLLVDQKTGNLLASLRPEGVTLPFLNIQASYPTIHFVAGSN